MSGIILTAISVWYEKRQGVSWTYGEFLKCSLLGPLLIVIFLDCHFYDLVDKIEFLKKEI